MTLDLISIQEAREKALDYRKLAKQGIHPTRGIKKTAPTFKAIAEQVHKERLPTWKNPKHGDQWLNTLRDYAFPEIGNLPVDEIDQPQVLACLTPIWTTKNETARRVAQRIKAVLDVAKSKGHRSGDNPVLAIKDARVLPTVKAKPKHHAACPWQDMPALYALIGEQDGMAANAFRLTCLTACRTSEVLNASWDEFDFKALVWTVPGKRMKGGEDHRVPLTPQMLAILEPLKALKSDCVFEGQKRHKPLSNMSMLMLLRRIGKEDITVHGIRSSFRDWASESAKVQSNVAEKALAHKVGNEVERAYARSDLLDQRRELMQAWNGYLEGGSIDCTVMVIG